MANYAASRTDVRESDMERYRRLIDPIGDLKPNKDEVILIVIGIMEQFIDLHNSNSY
jgi:hypothetical protein